ncbi:MAG: DUF4861 domain-containing protein [Bacteroidaceae bacterium]|nr:DUF4861 domain-containing protein [Bacteroidaceae bacterium]
MKNFLMLFCLLPLGLMAQTTFSVEVTNSWTKNKIDEPVVVQLEQLKTNFVVRSVVVREGNFEIPSQLDDLNQDRRPDELAFTTDLKAGQKKLFTITLSPERKADTYKARTHAQMYAYDKTLKHDYLTSVTTPGGSNIYSALYHHGPAFESELVAYRIYFNDWQTVDCYTKVNKQLELEDTKFYTTPEQLSKGYGDDCLIVGQTVSVGTLKGWDAQKQQVTAISPVEYRTETVISSGPVRAVVEVKDENWLYSGKELTMCTQYSLWAGHRDVAVKVRFAEPLAKEVFATGVLRKKGDSGYSDGKGLLGGWSIDFPQGDTLKYKRDTVGLAVFIPQKYVKEQTLNAQNYLYLIGAEGENELNYHFNFTCKRETFGYPTSKKWFAYLTEWKEDLLHPVKVRIQQ